MGERRTARPRLPWREFSNAAFDNPKFDPAVLNVLRRNDRSGEVKTGFAIDIPHRGSDGGEVSLRDLFANIGLIRFGQGRPAVTRRRPLRKYAEARKAALRRRAFQHAQIEVSAAEADQPGSGSDPRTAFRFALDHIRAEYACCACTAPQAKESPGHNLPREDAVGRKMKRRASVLLRNGTARRRWNPIHMILNTVLWLIDD